MSRRPRRRRPAALAPTALVAAVALVLAGCTAATVDGHGSARGTRPSGFPSSAAPSTSPSTGAPTQPKADFADCKSQLNLAGLPFPSGRLAKLRFGCATIKVPLDYAHPSGARISLQLLRIHDTDDAHPIGQLLVNPGGPGVSGLDSAVDLSTELSDAILTSYDIIGFDPRGVGLSSPLRCVSNHRKDVINAASPDVLTRSGFREAKSLARSVAQSCSRKYGAALAQFNSVNTAKDMDQIRQAAGDPSMHYLGFSYGTEFGSVYAHYFPTKIGRMVLDGAVDPNTGPITSYANQLEGFEKSFDQFSSKYCDVTPSCRPSLGNPRQAVYALQKQAMKKPIPVPGSSRKLTYNLLTTGVLQALYSSSDWSELGNALISAKHGNGSGLLTLADEYNERYPDGMYSNVAEANIAVSCNNQRPGPSDTTIRRTARSWVRRYPMFGLSNAATLFSCQQWQNDRTVPPKPTVAPPANKVLVLGNTHDPATPYKGALDLARAMGNAEVLSWDGEGHTSYLRGSSCVDSYVNAYLIHGTLPPQHKTCPA